MIEPGTPAPTFALDAATSSFEIRNYNWAKPFSNFLPGIAGPWGVQQRIHTQQARLTVNAPQHGPSMIDRQDQFWPSLQQIARTQTAPDTDLFSSHLGDC